jgi:hypothetical protein
MFAIAGTGALDLSSGLCCEGWPFNEKRNAMQDQAWLRKEMAG